MPIHSVNTKYELKRQKNYSKAVFEAQLTISCQREAPCRVAMSSGHNQLSKYNYIIYICQLAMVGI